MTMSSLRIEKVIWGPDKGAYKGKIQFEGEHGEVSVNLAPADCAKFFAVVADAITATSREVAERLTAECVAASPLPAMKIG